MVGRSASTAACPGERCAVTAPIAPRLPVMTPVVRLDAVLGLLAVALTVTAIWLAFDNPDIDATSRGDDYTCLAPWDTVVNDADNIPGGEPPPDAEEIGARCRDAGQTRLAVAGVSGSAAVALAGLTAARSCVGPEILPLVALTAHDPDVPNSARPRRTRQIRASTRTLCGT